MAPVHYHLGQFPPTNLDWASLMPLVGPAHAAIARYEGTLRGIPNANVLLSPLTTQEAVLSSRIEGTQATFGEVLEFEAGGQSGSKEREADIAEVLNYRNSLRHAVDMMEQLPLSLRVVKEAHRVLLQGVRGQDKMPGEFRRVLVWIGSRDGGIENARFIPVESSKVQEAIYAWENYLHADAPDLLIQLAVVHAEFEAIHPFRDGNGRIGRLLIPLFLVEKRILQRPNFYISEYLEGNREGYYDALLSVSRDRNWTSWCEFFLRALTVQARENEMKVINIMELYDRKKEWIINTTHSSYAITALDELFNRPVFRASNFASAAGIPKQTASRILRVARDGGLLRQVRPPSGRTSAILAFPELLNIAEGRPVI